MHGRGDGVPTPTCEWQAGRLHGSSVAAFPVLGLGEGVSPPMQLLGPHCRPSFSLLPGFSFKNACPSCLSTTSVQCSPHMTQPLAPWDTKGCSSVRKSLRLVLALDNGFPVVWCLQLCPSLSLANGVKTALSLPNRLVFFCSLFP